MTWEAVPQRGDRLKAIRALAQQTADAVWTGDYPDGCATKWLVSQLAEIVKATGGQWTPP